MKKKKTKEMNYKIPSREELVKRVSKASPSKRENFRKSMLKEEEIVSQIDLFLSGIVIGILSSIMVQSLFPPQQLYIFAISFLCLFISAVYFIRKRLKIQKRVDYFLDIWLDAEAEYIKRKRDQRKKLRRNKK
jgi:hypothetical protein